MAPYGSEGLTPTQSPTFSAAETVNSSTPSTSPCMISHACSHFDEDDDGDASLDLKQPCHGWPKLVDVMVEHPGFESFQAFRDLNLKSLLYYQAELVQLREELHEIEWQDHRKGGEQKDFCSDIQTLLLTRKDGEAAQKQLKKIKRIREVLKEYSKTLTHTTTAKVPSLIMMIVNR
jgi:hypothetical protein